MEQIQHRHVQVRGVKLHVAEIGSGPKVVLFLHGFPEIWYTWRHQMVAVANKGHRAIAIDFRGYGLSEQPAEPEKATFKDLIDDVVALLDSLSIDKAVLVGKDFGAFPAYVIPALHPQRVSGMITVGVPFMQPDASPVQFHLLPKGFYMSRLKEPGRAEADFGRFDVKTVIRNIYILFSGSELQVAADDQEIMDLVDPATPLPPWFSEEDLAAYASLYEKSGLHFPLQIPYRSRRSSEDYHLTDPKISAPSLLIMGEKDYFLKFPGVEDYLSTGAVKHFVPDLDINFIAEGTHFVQEQFPEQVNQLITSFLDKHGI
ncbi:hypothetical protein L3X38_018392 [Prunus dulcis]|uniref:AB hydrolase-1 domain-containing protein n=1 Tax=Prunus dulcis TaxID=3755 RepID=A0AAD4W8W7_PRUDU|nr:hypothetical protein L3X38_018392 [Prunus dulcis]